MKNKKIVLVVIISIIVILFSIMIFIENKTKKTNSSTVDDIKVTVSIDDNDSKINWSNYTEKSVNLIGSITITEEGIYNLTGTIEDGCITINTSGNVKLILNEVNIKNSNGPAIYIKSAKNVIIYLKGNNYLEDGTIFANEELNGTIYSKSNIVFDGSGTLEIKSNYQDGIVSKKNIKIINGNYTILANDDGICGKDSVYIIDGNFEINTEGDGIKSTNGEDEAKGFVKIENGSFNINSKLDGIQAETSVIITNGVFNITTGSESTIPSNNQKSNFKNTNTKSSKGIKAGNNIVITNGTFNLNTQDDSIHSNNSIGISVGTYNIKSEDDGIHADKEIIIDDGTIDISKSYEGIESSKITINNGNISVVASNDGINIADQSSYKNNYKQNTDNILTINAGTIYVNASGDGIDINGTAYINGGLIMVDGPTSNRDGALDYDNQFIVNGGTLIAVGSSGMAQGISNTSTQYGVLINLTNAYKAGDKITILDENSNEIIEYAPSKSYQSVAFSSDKLVKNKTYTLKINDVVYETFTIEKISTTMANAQTPGRPNRGTMR